MTPRESQPLGPEDQPHPDRERQQRDDDAATEYERHPEKERDRGRPDVEDGAWRTEATFGDESDTGDPARDEDDVDPIVHRGE